MKSLVLAVLLASLGGVAMADSLTLQNASFEDTNALSISCGAACAYNDGPIPGWTVSGAEGGSWMFNSSYYSVAPPDGSIVAYSNGGTISQSLAGVSLQPNSIYTLSVFVGDRLDSDFTRYSLSLTAGTTVLGTFSDWNYLIPMGTFQQEFLTYTTGNSVAAGDLGVSLTSAGPQSDFDDVQLTLVPLDPAFQAETADTPEPATFLMLGAGLLCLLLAVRKQAEA